MRIDLLDDAGRKIGELTDQKNSFSFTFIIWAIAIVFFIIIPIYVWYIFLFEPNFFIDDNNKTNFYIICGTALISSCASSIVVQKTFGYYFAALKQFKFSWLICSAITASVTFALYNHIVDGFWHILQNMVLGPIIMCELPCAISSIICRKYIREKK